MSYEAIDPLRLPSIALERRGALLPVPAVYFLIEADRQVVYVGQAVDLRARWVSHHCIEGASIAEPRIAWVEIEDQTERSRIEKLFISRHRPRLNIFHNPQLLLTAAPWEIEAAEAARDKQLYSTLEAAEQLGVTRARIRQLIEAGLLESMKIGKVHLITREGIKQARGRKRKPGPAAKKRRAA